MTVTVSPSKGKGRASAPPSKSMAHRALFCGALCDTATIENVAFSKDIEATLACLQALGATAAVDGTTVHIGGLSPTTIPENALLPCNESGSTLRFLLPLCMAAGVPVTLTGSERLFERPLTVYEDIARAQHIRFDKQSDRVTVCGRLTSGEYTVPGNISSQFITGLLFVLPLLAGDSVLTVTEPFESASYIDLTLQCLSDFGIAVVRNGNTFVIRGAQRFATQRYRVEGDCSNAAFLEALNVIGGAVQVDGLHPGTLQGDRVYTAIFSGLQQGVRVFDLTDCPDLAPIAFAMAAALGGATFTGTARLRIKESDRAAAMAQELQKFGIAVTVEDNAVTVHRGALTPPPVSLCGHNDHRIVMALTVLSTLTGGTIEGAEAVCKSYPDFFDILQSLQIGITQYDTENR